MIICFNQFKVPQVLVNIEKKIFKKYAVYHEFYESIFKKITFEIKFICLVL